MQRGLLALAALLCLGGAWANPPWPAPTALPPGPETIPGLVGTTGNDETLAWLYRQTNFPALPPNPSLVRFWADEVGGRAPDGGPVFQPGNDANDGLDPATPWLSVHKVTEWANNQCGAQVNIAEGSIFDTPDEWGPVGSRGWAAVGAGCSDDDTVGTRFAAVGRDFEPGTRKWILDEEDAQIDLPGVVATVATRGGDGITVIEDVRVVSDIDDSVRSGSSSDLVIMNWECVNTAGVPSNQCLTAHDASWAFSWNGGPLTKIGAGAASNTILTAPETKGIVAIGTGAIRMTGFPGTNSSIVAFQEGLTIVIGHTLQHEISSVTGGVRFVSGLFSNQNQWNDDCSSPPDCLAKLIVAQARVEVVGLGTGHDSGPFGFYLPGQLNPNGIEGAKVQVELYETVFDGYETGFRLDVPENAGSGCQGGAGCSFVGDFALRGVSFVDVTGLQLDWTDIGAFLADHGAGVGTLTIDAPGLHVDSFAADPSFNWRGFLRNLALQHNADVVNNASVEPKLTVPAYAALDPPIDPPSFRPYTIDLNPGDPSGPGRCIPFPSFGEELCDFAFD